MITTLQKVASIAATFAVLGISASPVLAQTSDGVVVAPAISSISKLDVSCIQNAIEARDTSISSAVGASATAVQTALSTRKTALKAAWAITVRKNRRAAINAAWSAYNKSAKSARATLSSARKSAWATFNASAKTCKSVSASDDPVGSSAQDSQL